MFGAGRVDVAVLVFGNLDPYGTRSFVARLGLGEPALRSGPIVRWTSLTHNKTFPQHWLIPMYEELFQTTDRPFRATPDVRFYFPFDSMEQTRQTVLRAVRRAEGPVAVMGGVGLGKSFLASMLNEIWRTL